MTKTLMILLFAGGLFACAHETYTAEQHNKPDVLIVQSDGTLYYRDRVMPPDDVILYDDGFGGERAAVKVYVPYKNDFFRDSIRVVHEDKSPAPVVSQN